MPGLDRLYDRIRARIKGDPRGFSTRADLTDIDRALERAPSSVRFWMLRGRAILLCDDEDAPPLDEAVRSFDQARRLSPHDPAPHIELGHYFDAVAGDPARAAAHFERALALGGGDEAEAGLREASRQLEDR